MKREYSQVFPSQYKKQRNQRFKRRAYKKRLAYGETNQSVGTLIDPYKNVPLAGTEPRKLVHLRYVDQIALNPSTSGVDVYIFGANALYDPNITSTGHQPNGFDQLMALFNHYTVIDSTCRVTPAFATVSPLTPGMWDVLLSDTTGNNPTTTLDLLESREGTGHAIQAGQQPVGGSTPFSITRRFNAKKFFGVPDIVGKADYRGDSASNPTDLALFKVCLGSVNGSDPASITFTVVLDFLAVMTEPINLGSS